MQTLADRPDLAKFVVSFDGYVCHVIYQPARRTTLLGRLAKFFRSRRSKEGRLHHTKASQNASKKILARALTNMVNLRSLSLPSLEYGLEARDLMLEVVILHLKDRLETIHIDTQDWYPLWGANTFQVESERLQSIAILSTQTNLQTLSIPCDLLQDFDWEKFNEELHLPRLTSLTCG